MVNTGTRMGGFPRSIWSHLRGSYFLEFTLVFALIALVVSLAAGFMVSSFVASDIRDKTLEDLSLEIEQVTSNQIVKQLRPEQLAAPLEGADLVAFDQFIRDSLLTSRTLRVNVYNREGLLVYSSEPTLIGESYGVGEHLAVALAGETETEIERIDQEEPKGEHVGLPSDSPFVEVYAPIKYSDPPAILGAFEIYQDYGPLAAHIRDIQKSVYIGIAAALAFVYLFLLLVVKRGSNLIRRQQKDVQAKSQELKSSYDSIVAVLCSALDLRDQVTHGHAQRVSELATVVAWQMGLRKEQVRQIEKAAILHDIGKIGVADAVLSKPGALTDQEWEEMRRHPELGYHILKDIDFLTDAAEIVYAHHERYDGTGYPRRLKGDDIPLGSRIFAVVDAYDAMTSHRPYRKAFSHHLAVEEIVRNSGVQFDPQVVRAFLEAERRGLVQSSQPSPDDVETFFARVTRSSRSQSPSPSESPSDTSAGT